uniref:Glyoxalase domain-containing protein 4 n=1 Tax=Caenorhabditis japonica TaxID=281687 RepID=A0A8R1E4A2_CAEJA
MGRATKLLQYEQAQLDVFKDFGITLYQYLNASIEVATSSGAIWPTPFPMLQSLQDSVKSAGGKIINELVTLPTPGKADVQVVILADPDDHEICFVGDEGFRALSKVDESAEKELREQIKKDDSEKWY